MRTNVVKKTPPVRTHEGAKGVLGTYEQQLRRSVMAYMLFEDSFYEDGQDIATRIDYLVSKCSPEFVANLAEEARTNMHLRHVPLQLIVGLIRARKLTGRAMGDAIFNVIQRPDEMAELLAMYWKNQPDAPLTKQMKVGLGRAMGKFSEFALAKNDRPGAVRLRDVMFLTHSRPVPAGKFKPYTRIERKEFQETGKTPKRPPTERENLYYRIAQNQMRAPDTWERRLSAGENKREAFEVLMKENKLGGLAFLRNLRNMLEAGVPIDTLRGYMVRANFDRVLPFRFVAAARYAPVLEDALELAMVNGALTLPRLYGRTAVVVDNSGSMEDALSKKSDMKRIDAAAALAVLVREVCDDVVVIGYGTDAKVIPPRRGFALIDAIKGGPGGGTDTRKAVNLAMMHKPDRIIVVTDEQSATELPKFEGKGYVINVAAYQAGIAYGDWVGISGWSEAVLQYITELENS